SQVAPFAALHQRRRKRRAGLFSTWFSLQPFFAILVTLSSLCRVPDSCQFPIGLQAPTRAGGLGGSCRMREEITAGVFVATGLADAGESAESAGGNPALILDCKFYFHKVQ